MRVNQFQSLSLFFGVISLIFAACNAGSASKGFTLEGEIQNAANLQAFLEQIKGDNTTATLGKADMNEKGQFSIAVEEGISEGIYRLRVGARSAMFLLEGKEKLVRITGNLQTLDRFGFEIEGSAVGVAYISTLKEIMEGKLQGLAVNQAIKEAATAQLGMQIALQGIPPDAESMPIFKEALARHIKERPDSEYNTLYEQVIQDYENQISARMAQEKVKIGEMAPDIILNDPKGKTYKLSDLKGQVVLLDFWASWCGPCRRANPKVVALYDKYNSKGFTVFSVSMDGIDDNMRARLAGSPDALKAQLDREMEKWVAAIDKDNLKWPYHVSDLKKWNCAPAQVYGVRSIPRTFLIDREGKIAAVNPRDLENAILNAL